MAGLALRMGVMPRQIWEMPAEQFLLVLWNEKEMHAPAKDRAEEV